jgi:5'-3' exonuclease
MNKYFDILNNINNSSSNTKPEFNSRILIIDGLNCFLRNFAMINHVNPNLQHIGGLTGFLKSLGHIIRLVQPTRAIIVFDGIGSSSTKKILFPEYKSNRNLTKITNWEIFETKEDEKESMKSQLIRLIDYLKLLPVSILSIDKIEADDVIGYISLNYFKDSQQVIIMSTDKDFYQLIDDRIQVYNPFKKYCLSKKDILEDFGVTPSNFPIYKTLLGDTSDAIPGVKGLGKKKIVKLFPFLEEDKEYDLNYILHYCNENKSKHSLYNKTFLFKNQLEINYQLIHLKNIPIMESSINEIISILNQKPPKLNLSKFIVMVENDQLGNSLPRPSNWLAESFTGLNY